MLRLYEFGLGCCLGVFRVLGLIGSGGLVGLGLSFVRLLLGFLVARPAISLVSWVSMINVPSHTTL